jgi:alkylation response protein AidB-like acyl-CoA dehydrogenase
MPSRSRTSNVPSEPTRLRHNDFRLSEEQASLRDAFRAFFTKQVPTERVRDAEPLGFDDLLWSKMIELGAVSMALANDDGPAATLVDLTVLGEEVGRAVAPAPWVEAVVASRLLRRLKSPEAQDVADECASGRCIATIALRPLVARRPQLVPSAAVANVVVGMEDGALTLWRPHVQPEPVANHANSPLAFVDVERSAYALVLETGNTAQQLHDQAHREWRLLTAATLIGVGAVALEQAIDFAKDRYAFGVPIGAFQAVSHALVDAATAVEGARNLNFKAAWFEEFEPKDTSRTEMAYFAAVQAAGEATRVGVHVNGGVGFTEECDQQLYFRRSRGWPLVDGDPVKVLSELADTLLVAAKA